MRGVAGRRGVAIGAPVARTRAAIHGARYTADGRVTGRGPTSPLTRERDPRRPHRATR
jgi:hypothetical protein